MPNKNITAYEATLLQKIFLIEYSVEDEKKRRPTEIGLKETDYDNIGTDVGVSGDTIQKIFGKSHNPGYLFQSTKLDTIIKKLDLENIKTWDSFLRAFPPFGVSNPLRIPNAQITDLNKELQEEIQQATKISLHKIYKDQPKKADLIKQLIFEEIEYEIPEKLKGYANTQWYIYGCFFLEEQYSKIVRTVVEIKNPPYFATSTASKRHEFDNYSGTVKLSKDERVLIFNMINDAQDREYRLLIVIGAGKRPQIALGEYLNIGRRGRGLDSCRIVMQYLGPLVKAKPVVLEIDSLEFKETPEPILRLLHKQSLNSRWTSSERQVYDLNGLIEVVKKEEENRYQSSRARLHKPFQVVLTSPRYSIDTDMFIDKYEQPLKDLKQFLEGITVGDDKAFEVHDYYLEADPKPKIPRSYSFYSDRIYHSEIVIALLFDEGGSICESELTLAVENGKTVHILTTHDERYLPKILDRYDERSLHARKYNKFQTPEEAVNFLKNDVMVFAREMAELEKGIEE